MEKRNFWRRGFAYAIDLFIFSIFVTIVAVVLNILFSSHILAPAFLKTTNCVARADLVTKERINELLPLDAGQKHQQILCKQVNMLTTPFYTTTLQKIWKKQNVNYMIRISYFSDKDGNQRRYISSNPFFGLVAPLVFAFLLTKFGHTPGKRLMRIAVKTATFEKPTIGSSLKREYFKAVFLVLFSLFGLYAAYENFNFDIDEAASQLRSNAPNLEESSLWTWLASAAAFAAAAFWFQFGSFIRWRNRTYWDRFADLDTGLTEEFHQNKSLNEHHSQNSS